MKKKRRLLSLLLAVVVLASIAIVAVSAAGPVKITNIGSTGNLSGIPSVIADEDITYLSDIYNTSAKKYNYVVPGGNGAVRDFALDQNFFGTRVYAFYGANDSKRQEVKKGNSNLDADGYRVLGNGVKAHYSDIILGRDATIFEKGLSFQPSAKDAADQATVIFDISNLDADYFYAVAGMTGEGNKSTYQRKIDFEVYGSKDSAYSETGMTFEKLAYAEGICAYLMGEFNIPISGYNYLKLVAVTKVSNTAAESAWANACVYSTPETTASASIAWDDTYNPTAIRPEGDLEAQLYADGVAVEGKTAKLSAANEWKCSWGDLPKYQDDLLTEIVYTVGIAEDPALHRLLSSENGVITYQYDATLTTIDLPVSVAWNEADAPDQSKRPSEIVVQLVADGVVVDGKTVTLNGENEWAAAFEKLAEKKRLSETETADIVYTLKVKTRSDYYSAKIAEGTEGNMVITLTYQESIAVAFPTIGKAGTLNGVPAEANGSNTFYLTDLYNGKNNRVIAQYISDGGKYKAFENYEGQVQVIYGSGASQQLVTETDTVVNGNTYQPTDIVLGANGTVYTEGLSFMVSAPSADDTYITYDLSGMNATRFYAVAGITGTANDLIDKSCYLTFEVWGKASESDEFVKLAYAENIRSYLLAEFDVDITGYNYLKLTAYNTESSSEGASAVWADALVCTNAAGSGESGGEEGGGETGGEEDDTNLPGKYTPSTDGSYVNIKAAEDSVVYLSEASETDAAKGKYITGYYVAPKSGATESRYPSLDYPFTKSVTSPIVVGAKDTEFPYGLGVLPTSKSSNSQNYTYILLDISDISDVDRFYAVAGLTGTGTDASGNAYGTVFEVYGSKDVVTDANDASFEKLAVSGDIFGDDSGEFDVSIEGYKTLKLVTLVAGSNKGGLNSNCQSIWANACVYKYDENSTAPTPPAEEGLPGVYTESTDGSYKWISNVKDGKVQYLSKLTYVDSSNNNGNPTVNDAPYGEAGKKIIIGEKNTGFTYGLGVHPKSGSAQSYTIYDLTGLDVDRFYAAVGITNEKGKAGSSKGVVFEVYADYTGNGNYKLLAESDAIVNKDSGEFHVDITGAKSLKLVTMSATGDHASSASAWGNACVYKYDANGSTPASNTTTGASNASSSAKSDNTGLKHIDGFTPSYDGEYTGIDETHSRSVIYLSDLTYLEASNTTSSAYPNGQPTTLDHPYNALTDLIIIGEMDRAFFNGLGVHPKNPAAPVDGSIESWTTYDLTGLDVDRFYAAVGITNDKGKEGASKGVIFKVYADYEGNGNYQLLSHSGCLDGRESGEFDLDITGVKTLNLAIESASSTHASSASAWANACVYDSTSVAEGVGKPVILEPSEKPEDVTEPTETTEPVELPGEKEASVPVVFIILPILLLLVIVLLLILLLLKSKKNRK